jgi:acetolactate synthase-1/2/3 large subunit
MRPISKAQFLVTSPSQLPDVMHRAFHLAVEGRRGPVVIDLPMNTQRGEISELPSIPISSNGARKLDLAAIQQVAKWISEAKRPVILAGQGVLLSGAQAEVRRLADRARIPVSQSLLGLGSFPTNSPLALGFHGHTGNQYAGKAIHGADLLLVCGSRLDVRQTGTMVNDFVPDGKVVRIDIDANEIDHSRVRSDLTIQGDVREVLQALNAQIEMQKNGAPQPDSEDWLAQIQEWRTAFPLSYDKTGKLKPQDVIETVDSMTSGQPVICVSGVGSHQQWVARHFTFDYPSRPWLTSGGHGAMGFDLPVAVGAQITFPKRPVICFVGDGSLQINIQELATIVEYKLPVKIVVLNNHRLGIVSQFQNLNWQSDPTCGQKWNPDFAAVARAYGIAASTVTQASEIKTNVEKALAHNGPYLIDCIVDECEDVVPMLLGGQKMDKMWPYA